MTLLDDVTAPRSMPAYNALAATWSPERTEQLKIEWAAGVPVRTIAKNLHVTRGSVVGKANRLGLPRRPAPEAIANQRAADALLPPVYVGEIQPANSIADQCRWLDGQVRRETDMTKDASKSFKCWSDVPRCTGQRVEGFSYCMAHCVASYPGFGTEDSAVAA